MAVLRGANVFAPGVLGIMSGVGAGEVVSVWADLDACIIRGHSLKYAGRKVFVGNGRVAKSRTALWKEQKPQGIYVTMTSPRYWFPSMDKLDPRLHAQNLPSCLVGDIGDTPFCHGHAQN
jgi:hypothetical protein